MNKFDNDGLLLCKIQAELFEKSVTYLNCSSEVFVRRYMNSKIVKDLDSLALLDDSTTILDIFDELEKEYGPTDYGSIKYHQDVMYWCGYLYRYFAYTYELSSKQVYKYLPLKYVASTYEGYHTMSVPNAIERLLEARNIVIPDLCDIQKGIAFLKQLKIKELKIE